MWSFIDILQCHIVIFVVVVPPKKCQKLSYFGKRILLCISPLFGGNFLEPRAQIRYAFKVLINKWENIFDREKLLNKYIPLYNNYIYFHPINISTYELVYFPGKVSPWSHPHIDQSVTKLALTVWSNRRYVCTMHALGTSHVLGMLEALLICYACSSRHYSCTMHALGINHALSLLQALLIYYACSSKHNSCTMHALGTSHALGMLQALLMYYACSSRHYSCTMYTLGTSHALKHALGTSHVLCML